MEKNPVRHSGASRNPVDKTTPYNVRSVYWIPGQARSDEQEAFHLVLARPG